MNNSEYMQQSRSQGISIVLSVNIIKKQSSLYWHIYIGKTTEQQLRDKETLNSSDVEGLPSL